jgi:hypothetical protein
MTLALAEMKAHGLARVPQFLASFLEEKGFSGVARYLRLQPDGARLFAQALGQFVLQLPLHETTSQALRQAIAAGLAGEAISTYTGSPAENRRIVRWWSRDEDDPFLEPDRRPLPFFSLQGFRLPEPLLWQIGETPIVIVGAGAAGVLAARMCVDAGFQRVRVLDTTGMYGGIWQLHSVRNGSRNNPVAFGYERFRVEAAPGRGEEITQFLEDLVTPPPSLATSFPRLPVVERARVERVEPGDLLHRVFCTIDDREEIITTPLLVCATGQGRPLSASRPGVMTTNAGPDQQGHRFQRHLTPEHARALVGKTVVLVGLGNSTAEMLIQLQRYRDAGLDIRYKVLTHYPAQAIWHPDSPIHQESWEYRVFRDVSGQQFTRLAGDLADVRTAFERARQSGNRDAEEILPDVMHWDWQGEDQLVVMQRRGEQHIPCDELYTLIGTGHSRETLEAMGMVVEEAFGGVAHDYDGEIQCAPLTRERPRLYPGYFGLGSVLKSTQNPDAQVIPDMLTRLPDLFFTLFMRAIEYSQLR